MKNKPVEKLRLALAGVVLGLIACELSLRAAGLIYRRLHAPRVAGSAPSSAKTVLCLGDSFTYGVGAPEGSSYPDRLQALLDQKAGPGRFRVLNLGVPGQNSAQALALLEGRLEADQPDVVIALTGMNDSWNFEGLDSGSRLPAGLALQKLLLHSRLFRLLRLSWKAAAAPAAPDLPPAAGPCRPGSAEPMVRVGRRFVRGDPPRARALFGQAVETDPCSEKAWIALGWSFADVKPAEAKVCFEKALALNPRSAAALVGLGHAAPGPDRAAGETYYRKALRIDPRFSPAYEALGWIDVDRKPARAAAEFRRALELNPRSAQALVGLGRLSADATRGIGYLRKAAAVDPGQAETHCELGRAYLRANRLVEAASSFETSLSLAPRSKACFQQLAKTYRLMGNPGAAAAFAARTPGLDGNEAYSQSAPVLGAADPERLIEENTRRNVTRLAELSRARRFALIVCSYPDEEFAAVRAGAEAFDLPSVDFVGLFSRRFKDKADYSVSDGHCNARGYDFMARILADLVVKL